MRMRRFGNSLMRRFLKNQEGQALVAVMITASTMMALAAASIETGHVYYAYQKLVASTNASVMAGAEAMPNTTTASTYVATYSAQSNGLNANPDVDECDRYANFQVLQHRVEFAERAVPDLHGRQRGIQRAGGDADRDGSLVVWRAGRHEADDHVVHGGSGDGRRAKQPVEYCHYSGHDRIDERL